MCRGGLPEIVVEGVHQKDRVFIVEAVYNKRDSHTVNLRPLLKCATTLLLSIGIPSEPPFECLDGVGPAEVS